MTRINFWAVKGRRHPSNETTCAEAVAQLDAAFPELRGVESRIRSEERAIEATRRRQRAAGRNGAAVRWGGQAPPEGAKELVVR